MMRTRKKTEKSVRSLFYAVLFLTAVIFIALFWTSSTANAGTGSSGRHKYFTSIEIEGGTSLWDIAETYMTAEYGSAEEYIEEVKAMNHLKSDLIYEGSYLCIPYYSSEIK